MPFGPYGDFDECVADNQDKSSPEGYCAWLHHEITGEWPSDMSMLTKGLPKQVSDVFLSTFKSSKEAGDKYGVCLQKAVSAVSELGWHRRNGQWMKVAQLAVSTRTVMGVEVFAEGVHNGDPYTAQDLDTMILAFYELRGRIDPPVKIGHTSDAFNKDLAEAMNVPEPMIVGENGNGAMALGWISNLRRETGAEGISVLMADFVDVPSLIAEVIDSRSYNKVSAEIMFDVEDEGKRYPKVLSGVALLGAELPAVRDIKGLETAAVFTHTGKPNSVIEFAQEDNIKFDEIEPTLKVIEAGMEKAIKGRSGARVIRALWKEVVSKYRTMLGKNKKMADHPSKSDITGDLDKLIKAVANGDIKLKGMKAGEFQGNVDVLIDTWNSWAGSFTECVSTLSGKAGISNPEALCAWLHHEAEGVWPGEGKAAIKKSTDNGGVEEMKDILVKLGLKEDASQEDAVTAIAELQEKATKADEFKLSDIAKVLDLEESATLEDVLTAIKGIKDKLSAKHTDEPKDYAEIKERITKVETENASLKRAAKVAEFKAECVKLTAISGTPDELAEKLMKLEEKDPEVAKEHLEGLKTYDAQLKSAGITKVKGTGAEGDNEDEHEFIKKVREHQKEKKVDEAAAFKAVMDAEKELFSDYMKTRKRTYKVDTGDEEED